MSEHLTLKWRTLKSWQVESPAALAALKQYFEGGAVSMGAMQQHDTDEQKQALCTLIDAVDCEIVNDWSGETMTKDEAKLYVMGHAS